MYSLPKAAFKFINYWLTASNGKGHGIHSPFVYAFIREVLMDNKHYEAYDKPEQYREKLLRDRTVIEVQDMGAGAEDGRKMGRRICDIARTSGKHKRYPSLLYRAGNYFGSRKVLELGTSLGITSMYLSAIHDLEELVTLEGADAIADNAEKALADGGSGKVRLVRGNFDVTLPGVLKEMGSVDLVFIDGNHRKEPTLRYFEEILPYTHNNSCLVFDDIHWSGEMEEAWGEICKDRRVTLTIDLHAIGFVFFRKEIIEKQDFVIRY